MTAAAFPAFRAATAGQDGRAAVRDLDALLDLPAPALAELYANATTPRLEDVKGPLRGRMLVWPWIDANGGFARFLRAFAGARSFPWKGKTFTPLRGNAGEGINRVFSERFTLFRFETHVSRSKAGDFDAVQLDYDLPENPPIIRSIEDEIREIAPGLWLGQAWIRIANCPRLWLWFALGAADAR